MSRGKRYDGEAKLNKKKVGATIIAIIVIVMVIVSIRNLFKQDKTVPMMMSQTAYFTVYDNGKYGVIDNKGNNVVNLDYDEMIIIPDKTKDVFICTYDVDYENETYKTRVINSKGEEILTGVTNVEPIEKRNLNEVWYDTNLLKYSENGKYGLIDFDGKKVTEAEYDDIYALDQTEKSIIVEKNGKKGVVNSSLKKLVVDCNFDNVSTLDEKSEDNGYIVSNGAKYGVISASGKTILETNYNEIEHVTGNSMYVVNDGSGLKLIDSNLNTILDNGFDSVKSINGDNLVITKGSNYGVITKTGEEKIPTEYQNLTFATDNYYVAEKNNLYGIISIDNTVCVDFKYANIEYVKSTNFYEAENSDFTTDILDRNFEAKLTGVVVSELNTDSNYVKVRTNGEYKYYTLNFEEESNINALKSNTLFLAKKDGKYGYVNKDGELIVDYKYDDAKEQNQYGYMAVKKDGVWGCLKSDGTQVLEPSVNLDNNLYIDFIGEWHLFEDNALNLYVK